jgi:hypothetical protein
MIINIRLKETKNIYLGDFGDGTECGGDEL